MKIVFINRFFFPDHSATSQLLTDLTLHLAGNGFEVQVLTSRLISDSSHRLSSRIDKLHGVEIVRIWSTGFGRTRLAGRAVDYLTFYMSALWHLLFIAGAGVLIVAKTDPPLISVLAAFASRIRGAVLVNWIQDLFPEVASALAVNGSGWLERPLRALRNRSLLAARHNVVIGEGMAGKLRSEGIPSDAIRVIHNWADGLAIQPVERGQNDLRVAWGLQNKFVVGYSGNFGRAHEFETILLSAELLREEKHIAFLFIGAGAQLEWMKREVEKRHLDNVDFKPYQPRDRLAVSLSVPDIHVISLQPALEGLIVPSKFYGIAAAGRPMLYIGDRNGEIPRLLRSAQCGFAVEIKQAEQGASIIRDVAQDENACRSLGHRARTLFDQRFERRFAENAWASVIAETVTELEPR